jgi:hypothetical protein
MDVLSRLRARVFAIALIAGLAPAAASAQETLEPDVKATFLYNFTRFIEWPGPAGSSSAPFRLCVVADPTMEQAIKRAVDGEVVSGRPMMMTLPQTAQEAEACQILFVGRTEHDRAAPLLTAVRNLPVLTVGDSPQFFDHGGAIRFVLVDNRVRFDVHLPHAQRARLKISAKLLRVARNVEAIR